MNSICAGCNRRRNKQCAVFRRLGNRLRRGDFYAAIEAGEIGRGAARCIFITGQVIAAAKSVDNDVKMHAILAAGRIGTGDVDFWRKIVRIANDETLRDRWLRWAAQESIKVVSGRNGFKSVSRLEVKRNVRTSAVIYDVESPE